MVKKLLEMQEAWVQSLGQEDSPGEGNGNPLQYSCLENPTDRGAWQATVHGVAKVGYNLGIKPPQNIMASSWNRNISIFHALHSAIVSAF